MLDGETLKYYLQSIEELVSDEEKILTYTGLAHSLSIPINLAKHLLEIYVKEHKEDKLQITYFVSGVSGDNCVVMDVIEQEKVPVWLKTISATVSKHIYSVGKGTSKQLDIKSLCLTGNFDEYISLKSIISSDHIIKSSEESLQNLREKAYMKILGSEPKKINHTKVKVQELPKVSQVPKTVIQEKIHKNEEKIVNNQINSKQIQSNSNVLQLNGNLDKKNSIVTMFAAQSNQKSNKNSASSLNKASNQKTKGIQGFFQKQKEVENVKQHDNEITQDTKPNKTDIVQSIKKEIKQEPPKEVSAGYVKEEETVQLSNKTSKKVISPIVAKAKVKKESKKSSQLKKRKRVICMSDSDSDEMEKDPFEDNIRDDHVSSDDEVIPPTPQVDVVKAVALNTNAVNPRKKRKVIDKTYTDEDGYILTKKEVVYESCSEDDDATEITETPVKDKLNSKKPDIQANRVVNNSPIKAKKTKKVAAPVAGKNKQATLTNFFKKS